MSQVETGRVKWFNEKKGFGFIVNQNGDDIFIHYRDINGTGFLTLHENELVSYTVAKGPKGYKAQDVTVIRDE
ncbi:cold shock protein; Qin prophage [Legionella beliardensis]|uniref:Cold shock protein Qin prophage n=1 Tax=Legionella beliardensis TaxID=91822 RepID=A0A378I0L1_9GAMM|nr:cold shock domain-containing protein [Legionella beliardensis]STX28728.1 cold shock protein; Qin prophage [Legionella beliardensis]